MILLLIRRGGDVGIRVDVVLDPRRVLHFSLIGLTLKDLDGVGDFRRRLRTIVCHISKRSSVTVRRLGTILSSVGNLFRDVVARHTIHFGFTYDRCSFLRKFRFVENTRHADGRATFKIIGWCNFFAHQ